MTKNRKIIIELIFLIAMIATSALIPSIAPILAAIIMIRIPIVAATTFSKITNATWKIFGLGALAFIVSQVGHIPFNQFVLNPFFEKYNLSITYETETLPLFIISVVLGLSAGVFEEVVRYIWYRFFLKNNRNWKDGIMLGLGHGGAEAILLGLNGILAFIQISTLKGADLSQFGDQQLVAQEAITAYLNTEWFMFLLGAVERFSAVMLHVGLSVIVLQVFRKKKIGYLFIAIAAHALFDAFAVFASVRMNLIYVEIIILILAALTLFMAFKLREDDDPDEKTDALNAFSHEKVLTLSEIKQSLVEKQNLKNTPEIEDSHYE